MGKRIETVIENDSQYVYGITGIPQKFLDIKEHGIGSGLPFANPNIKAHLGIEMLRKKRIIRASVTLMAFILVIVIAALFAGYTAGISYLTNQFVEDDFNLIYSEGMTLSVVSQEDVLLAIAEGRDINEFKSATICYSGKPALIGYRIDIQNPEVIFIVGGRIYGISEGRSNIYVYSQDGTYLTMRNIIVE